MTDQDEISADLPPWDNVAKKEDWSGILLGNGASIAVWDGFRYSSLFDKACSPDLDHPLSEADKVLFGSFAAQDFELILSALVVSGRVVTALNQTIPEIGERYESIRQALVEAVKSVHVPWQLAAPKALPGIRRALLDYDFVFSTNYDLLVYWAIMSEDAGEGFKDYFWGERFDASNTQIWGKATKVLYLHGGIHLYHHPTGETFKRHREDARSLLDLFGEPPADGAAPLFVSEGTADQKLAAISRSDYLSFAYSTFSGHEGPLVVFGHSLAPQDDHLLEPLRRWRKRQIAIAILPATPQEIVSRKASYIERLPDAELSFFDATTHPLGSEDLKVEGAEHG